MPTLRDLQHALRASLVERQHDAAAAAIIADDLPAEDRLGIYRNTFIGTLTMALRLSYPAVERLVGAEFFDAAASIFIRDEPPRSAYLNEYGAGLADFLAGFPPAASLAYLPDVARLEWAVNRALHAADAAALDIASLGALDPADHGRIRFTPDPSLGLVRAGYPVDEIWRAVLARDDAALARIDPSAGPVWLIVQRRTSGIDVARLGEAAWRFTSELCAGRPLQAALDGAAGIDATALLADHLAAGRFAAYELADSGAASQPPEIRP